MTRTHQALVVAAGLAALGALVAPDGRTAARRTQAGTPAAPYREVCRLEADPRNMFTRVGPPWEQGALMRLDSLAAITVNYTGFTPEAQAAFQYAVDVWQAQLTSTVPIRVNAQFTVLGPGILGSAGATNLWRDFAGATFPGTWYAQALANKLHGSELNPGSADISASFNSDFTWYYGTDGNTPAGQYDFVSVVLHELTHGLGFSGTMRVVSGLGSWGYYSGPGTYYPGIYDRFTENGSGQYLLNTTLFPNNSLELAAQLTSDNLFWNGPNGVAANAGITPKLYVPSAWSQGSSYAHLDDATYPAGNVNSLMTHAIGAAEAIHDPGPITRGMFTDEGWTVAAACTYGISPTSATYGQSGGTGSVSVSTTAGCAWTASSSDPSWLSITSGATGSGSGSVGYSVGANSGASRMATLTIAGQTFTVTQGPTFSLSPSTLRLGAVNASGTLTSVTSAQTVTVTQTDSPTLTWTATPSQPWIQVSPASGSGNATFSVSIVNTGALPPTGTLTGTIMVSAAGAANAPGVAVSLTLYPPGGSGRAVGVLDWLYGETTVSGSIVVGGWALDDVEISRVEVFRDRVPGEPLQGVFPPTHPGYDKIYLANAEVVRTLPFGADTALFVDGSRTDIEALFPSSPWNYRAGWGYLLLTWGLPNQGTGTYTIHAYAFDRDGTYPTDYTLLGSKTFTSDNSPTAAPKPFGAIDAPYPGETVSGVKLTGGWALTQPVGCSVTTVQVAINSGAGWGPLSPVLYGDPKPGFETYFPPTSFVNSPNAGAAYFFDSTGYANGVHQFGYLVTDSCGHQEGIGSRFITIFNSSSSVTAEHVEGDAANTASLDMPVVARPPDTADAHTAFALTDRPTRTLDAPRTTAAVRVARGYGEWGTEPAATEAPARDGRGVSTVVVRPLERVALHLPRPRRKRGEVSPAFDYAGYQAVRGQLRRLPVGSSLNTSAGVFYWEPGPGFLGAFDLVFVRTDASGASVQVPVRVEVRADRVPRPAVDRVPGVSAPGRGAPPPAPEPVAIPPAVTGPSPTPEPQTPAVEPALPDATVDPVAEGATVAAAKPAPTTGPATEPTADPAPPAPALRPAVTPAREARSGETVPNPRPAPARTAVPAPAPSPGVAVADALKPPVRVPAGPAAAGVDAPRYRADAGPDRTVDAIAGWATVTLRASLPGGAGEALCRWSGTFGAVEGPQVDVTLPLGTHAVTLSVEADGERNDDTLIVTVRDPSPPRIEARISPTPDERGVVSGPARISWIVTDPESGVARLQGCEEVRLSTTGTERCSATNGAGLTVTRVVFVKVSHSK